MENNAPILYYAIMHDTKIKVKVYYHINNHIGRKSIGKVTFPSAM